MPSMLHEVAIEAPAQTVFDAISKEEGLKSWWTDDTSAPQFPGSTATFGFVDHTVIFRMEIEALDSPRLVRWRCLGDVDEWIGTTLRFNIGETADNGTKLQFVHGGWSTTDGIFPMCNTTWGALMIRLKDYCEGRNPGPFFTSAH